MHVDTHVYTKHTRKFMQSQYIQQVSNMVSTIAVISGWQYMQ